MILYQLAGFLGSGKTTLMIRLGNELAQRGRRVAIIVNEIGEVGIDGDLVSSFGLESIELTEGCICCSLSGSLQSTLKTLADGYKPEYVLLEPTGLALPSRVDKIVRTSLVPVERSVTIALVDAYRVERLIDQSGHFFKRQLDGASVVALNKIDLIARNQLDGIVEMIRELNPDIEIVPISARTGEGVRALLERVRL